MIKQYKMTANEYSGWHRATQSVWATITLDGKKVANVHGIMSSGYASSVEYALHDVTDPDLLPVTRNAYGLIKYANRREIMAAIKEQQANLTTHSRGRTVKISFPFGG